MNKRNLKRGTFFYNCYLYYYLFLKEKCFIKRKTYSQWGEDLVIDNFFKDKIGKYVDIGCFHPIRHSNTCLLFNRGWSGVNIDVNPASIDQFNIVRKTDVNVLAAVSDQTGKQVDFYFEHYFSTINSMYTRHLDELKVKYIKQKVYTKKFTDIVISNFDFLNIDCEGEDYNILKTIDLNKFSPELICIEIVDDEKTKKLVHDYLLKFNYKLLSVRRYSYLYEKIKT